jgi:hypothetical protein
MVVVQLIRAVVEMVQVVEPAALVFDRPSRNLARRKARGPLAGLYPEQAPETSYSVVYVDTRRGIVWRKPPL